MQMEGVAHGLEGIPPPALGWERAVIFYTINVLNVVRIDRGLLIFLENPLDALPGAMASRLALPSRDHRISERKTGKGSRTDRKAFSSFFTSFHPGEPLRRVKSALKTDGM